MQTNLIHAATARLKAALLLRCLQNLPYDCNHGNRSLSVCVCVCVWHVCVRECMFSYANGVVRKTVAKNCKFCVTRRHQLSSLQKFEVAVACRVFYATARTCIGYAAQNLISSRQHVVPSVCKGGHSATFRDLASFGHFRVFRLKLFIGCARRWQKYYRLYNPV